MPAQSEASSDSERSNGMATREQEEELLVATSADEVSPHEGVLSSSKYNPAAVKMESDVAMSSSSGAAAAVRYVTVQQR